MDVRSDEDDGGAAAPPATKRTGASRKGISYSQPLGRDAVISGTARRSALRKHSLDDDRIYDSSILDAQDPSRSYSSPPLAFYQHSYSIEDGRQILPPTIPHHVGGGQFSLDRRGGPGGSSVSGSHGSFTLERAMSECGGARGTLPEFVGKGGGVGMFRVPLRAAVHPGRPPALELRPHPLRETQAGAFLRTFVSQRNQLWAGTESGLRVWNLEDVFERWPSMAPKKGDEETVPFRESCQTSPVLCLVVDDANGVIWSGHKDGKIRSWKREKPTLVSSSPGKSGDGCSDYNVKFKEGLTWQAHSRTAVLSMVITNYGEIWSGSENGTIKAWPWDSLEKALSLTTEERHLAALIVERTQVTVNDVTNLPSSDVKFMASDSSRSKVWSGGSISFALWDARTRDLLKVFNIDGQIENRVVDAPSTQESHVEDEMKVKMNSSSKKEKSQGSLNFFQRSRNALIGAADAVRRVAAKGSFNEENRKTEAIAISMDGFVWTGCTNGYLIQWDGNGNRLLEMQHHSSSVQSICPFGNRLWVGYASGILQVLDLEGNLLGGWTAHSSPVIRMAVGGSYVFTLAQQGGIRGWNLKSPGPLDEILRLELASKEMSYTKLENFKILAGTWNVGQERASHDSLISWLATSASDVGLVVVGLQEVEMGAGFLAMAAAKESVGLEGSANGQWWLDTIGKTLDEGTSFHRVGSRQLAGLLIAAWARKNLRPYIGDVEAAAVPCGFGRAIGNKGGVGLKMRAFDRILCFVNCHFAAHLEAVSRRNADFDHIYRTMSFSRPTAGLHGTAAGPTAVQLNRAVNATVPQLNEGKPELSEADMIVFLGDFNYRLHSITYDEARDMVSQRCFDWLREKDQLRAEMKAGKVFQGMREGLIRFPPTYKFERHQPGLAGYDAGEKKRIPAWCDRILYRDSRAISVAECTLGCPVVASIELYEACMDVNDSDHKPVRCIFNVEIAHRDELIRRQKYGEILASNEKIKSLIEESCIVPETIVSTNNILLQDQETSILRITNKCQKQWATFQVCCEGVATIKDGKASEFSARASYAFPFWLQVGPTIGLLGPGDTKEVTVDHEDFYTQEEIVDGIPQNWWCEDTRDKEVIILVNITGTGSTERTSHRVHVRHCVSTGSSSTDTKKPSKRNHANHLLRSDIPQLGNSSDVVNDLHHMRCP